MKNRMKNKNKFKLKKINLNEILKKIKKITKNKTKIKINKFKKI